MPRDTDRPLTDLAPADAGVRDEAWSSNWATSRRVRLTVTAVAILVAVACSVFSVVNTSIGWHLASGRWVMTHHDVPRADPFSFTATGAAWIDHEWLFQLLVAAVDELAGPPGLVGVRVAAAVALVLLLVTIGRRSGVSEGVSLLLAALCVFGARGRLFVRPELVTLLVAPLCTWMYLQRDRRLAWRNALAVAALVGVGVNAHGAVLVVPVLLTALLAAEALQAGVAGSPPRPLGSGLACVLAAWAAPLANPYGWRLYEVPLRLSRLVDRPWIPNPEWISPSPAQAPLLYAALALALLVLLAKERDLARWMLLAAAAALALRHVRNVGLFFALLPLAVAPGLGRWPAFGQQHDHGRTRRRSVALAAVLAASLAAAALADPWPPLGLGLSSRAYPVAACDFMDRHGLPAGRLYNDVNFGGYLIGRYFPPRQVFIDDRNEIHERLLAEIWRIFQTSDRAAWRALLGDWDIDTALVRYHPPWRVTDPEGRPLGWRGFSALWFPREEWALVHWDDVAMVLVRRDPSRQELIDRLEYRLIRPDDVARLQRLLSDRPALVPQVAAELRRAVAADPEGERARRLFRQLLRGSEDETPAR